MAMRVKLHFIRYYYSEMMHHSLEGGPFIRPMFYDFPDDIITLEAP